MSISEPRKPLFIPLRSWAFSLFYCGTKNIEYRAYGPRWNEKTCTPGRPVTLSNGYRKERRLSATIKEFSTLPGHLAPEAVRLIYRNNMPETVACIRLQNIAVIKPKEG